VVGAPDPHFDTQRSKGQSPLLIGDAAKIGRYLSAPRVEIFEPILRQAPCLSLRRQFGLICFKLAFLRRQGFQLVLNERSYIRIVRDTQLTNEVSLFAIRFPH
jgi:hypothetical protein